MSLRGRARGRRHGGAQAGVRGAAPEVLELAAAVGPGEPRAQREQDGDHLHVGHLADQRVQPEGARVRRGPGRARAPALRVPVLDAAAGRAVRRHVGGGAQRAGDREDDPASDNDDYRSASTESDDGANDQESESYEDYDEKRSQGSDEYWDTMHGEEERDAVDWEADDERDAQPPSMDPDSDS